MFTANVAGINEGDWTINPRTKEKVWVEDVLLYGQKGSEGHLRYRREGGGDQNFCGIDTWRKWRSITHPPTDD